MAFCITFGTHGKFLRPPPPLHHNHNPQLEPSNSPTPKDHPKKKKLTKTPPPEFTSPLPGLENITAQCQNCGNWSAHCITRWPWFTLCFVPVLPLATHKYHELACPICHFMQDLSQRPDVQGQGAGPMPVQGQGGYGGGGLGGPGGGGNGPSGPGAGMYGPGGPNGGAGGPPPGQGLVGYK